MEKMWITTALVENLLKNLHIRNVFWLLQGHASYTKTIETFELGNLVKEFNIIFLEMMINDPYYEIATLESSSYPFFPCQGARLQSRPMCYCWHASCFLTYHTEGTHIWFKFTTNFFFRFFSWFFNPSYLSHNTGRRDTFRLSPSYPIGTSRQ